MRVNSGYIMFKPKQVPRSRIVRESKEELRLKEIAEENGIHLEPTNMRDFGVVIFELNEIYGDIENDLRKISDTCRLEGLSIEISIECDTGYGILVYAYEKDEFIVRNGEDMYLHNASDDALIEECKRRGIWPKE